MDHEFAPEGDAGDIAGLAYEAGDGLLGVVRGQHPAIGEREVLPTRSGSINPLLQPPFSANLYHRASLGA